MPRVSRCSMVVIAISALLVCPDRPAFAQPAAPQVETFVERSPLLYEPKTPEEMFSAVLLMVDLARLDLAGRYLQQFIDSSPDDELLIKLRDKYGTGEFLKLSRIKSLKNQADPLLDSLSAASRKQAEDPAYAEVLISKLTGDPVQRELSIRELRNLSEAAVPHLLRKLALPASDAQADQIILALGRIGQPALAPTIAGLESPNQNVRQGALAAIDLLRSPVAIPYLWHPAFAPAEVPEMQQAARRTLNRLLTAQSKSKADRATSQQAALQLRAIAKGLYHGQFELPLDDDGTVVIWRWDDEAGTVIRQTMPVEPARLYWASRFSRQALDLTPDMPEAQRLYLGTLLGWTVAQAGRDQLIPMDPETPGYVALTAGEEAVTALLSEALTAGQTGTAQAALQILSQIGSHQMIFGGQGRKSAVLGALNYPDLRVQFAAANAVLRQEPSRTFRGADRVVSILTRAITSAEEPKALIVDADSNRAEITSGYLSDLGYQGIQARTGKEAFQIASTTAGIDLAVIQINCIQWDLSQTVANLRADARTAYLPIVFYGPEDITDVMSKFGRKNGMAFPEAASSIWNGTLPPGRGQEPIRDTTRMKLRNLILSNGPATFVAESGSGSDFVNQVRPFIGSIAGANLTAEERAKYQAISVRWLAHISQSEKNSIFDLAAAEEPLSELTESPELAQAATIALAGIESPTMQRRFLAMATNLQLAPALRVAAANQLSAQIQRHGVTLTEDEVREVHALWQKEEDSLVSSALATVIGSLRPEAKTVGERIGKLPAPR